MTVAALGVLVCVARAAAALVRISCELTGCTLGAFDTCVHCLFCVSAGPLSLPTAHWCLMCSCCTSQVSAARATTGWWGVSTGYGP
jgi:hypothetical protein